MGRPKFKEKKDTFLHIRLNKNERQNMEDVCLQNNLSLSNVARQGIKKEIKSIELNSKKHLVKELEDLIFISYSIEAEKEVLEIIIIFRNWIKYLIKGTTKIPKNSIFKIKIYKFNYAKLKNFKDAVTNFLDEEKYIGLLTEPQLDCFEALDNWLQNILNLSNNKNNSAPETKRETLDNSALDTDTDTEDSGFDSNMRRKNNQTEF
ncbi:hypothetical protein SAMN02745136_04770 [Anaerocolumna jejuensis DSM 15929]|uniref:Uncharacterized protein n=1 Tax=Anaerocolumna jejuensis DSM 15929 TaxID=1121322 RepID=A0A1M7A6L7_9FIRM|nr:hypothetical protein [Anaerocolumna jejuensis]SHL38384.1 hypothetical protein SAMN02745136_04770 [Anaerocolumna jejuensis DSM 15929]